MKTAMQELIDDLDNTLVKSIFERLEKDGLFNKALEKEKEQIMNAYCDGAKGGANGTKGQHENGWVSIQMRNKYFNQTYNN
jgi:hypothetical protein